MPRVVLDTVEPDNKRFRKYLADNGITISKLNDPRGLAYLYNGSKEALENMIDRHFMDDYLKEFIKEDASW